jgi:hypothetical protein
VLRAYFEAQQSDGSRRPLADGDTLRSRDHFWFELSAQEPMYVYVVYVAADGAASVLYPDSGDVVLKPGYTERLPKSLDFVLDDVTGWERVLIIASRAPLSQADSSFARLVDRVRSSRTWPEDDAATGEASRPKPADSVPKKPRTPPASQPKSPAPAKVYEGPTPVLETRLASADRRGLTRGIHLGGQKPGHVAAVPDEHGIVTIPLFIRHAP